MWWHILGVDSDCTKADVKKAYAKIIKGVDQDNDIDEFTKIHAAFRMALKSFKQYEDDKKRIESLNAKTDDYINYLQSIYSNPNKRLKAKVWEDVLACMSFKEEESFKDKYIDFFNTNYLLIDEIWKLVDKQYPLSGHKDFLWKDLINGNFSIDLKELNHIPEDLQADYVESKMSIYYDMMNKNFESVIDSGKKFIKSYSDKSVSLWYMSAAISSGNVNKIEEAYRILIESPETQIDGHYKMAGFYTSIGEYDKSQAIVSSLSEKDIYIEKLQIENEQSLINKENSLISRLPWKEIDLCSKKKIKFLNNGNYQKALKTDVSALKSILGKGGIG